MPKIVAIVSDPACVKLDEEAAAALEQRVLDAIEGRRCRVIALPPGRRLEAVDVPLPKPSAKEKT